MRIKTATAADRGSILDIHRLSFGAAEGPVIAELVEKLLRDPTAHPILSLVAEECDRLIGHILFTRAGIPGSPVSMRLLAPLAVLPENQGRGVGRSLIEEGLRRLKESGIEWVFVLGHPSYYPRFGFTPAGRHGFDAPYPISQENAEAWMVLELNRQRVGQVSGKVHCASALNRPHYWTE